MRLFVLYLILGTLAFRSSGQSITVTGTWNVNVASNTISEAGNNYSGTVTSSSSQTSINLAGLSWLGSYSVSVRKIEGFWDNALDLKIRRTGPGTFTGWSSSITGGEAFFSISTSNQPFFSGSNFFNTVRNNIPIQYEISGISVLLPVRSYSTTVVYTVSN